MCWRKGKDDVMVSVNNVDIDLLTGRELDAAIAVEVLKWKKRDSLLRGKEVYDLRDGYPVGELRYWSKDANHVREVETGIERQDKKGFYIMALIEITHGGISEDIDAWLIATATPEQRCRAALKAVLGRDL
jgi:hypothetical protein